MFTKYPLLFLCLFFIACSDEKSQPAPVEPTVDVEISQTEPGQVFIEGEHYRVLKQPIETGETTDKITVTEFFWYGCSHCKKFEPYIDQWQTTKPENVVFQASPAIWSQLMELHAMAFFIAQSHSRFKELHSQLFATITTLAQEKSLEIHKKSLANLFAQYGLTEKAFNLKLESKQIEQQLKAAINLMNQVKISGTPTIMVNGKYVVLTKSIKTYDDILAITDFLINKEITESL